MLLLSASVVFIIVLTATSSESVWEGTYLSGESILMYSKLTRSKAALLPFRRLTTMWHVYTNIIMLLIQVHRNALNMFKEAETMY